MTNRIENITTAVWLAMLPPADRERFHVLCGACCTPGLSNGELLTFEPTGEGALRPPPIAVLVCTRCAERLGALDEFTLDDVYAIQSEAEQFRLEAIERFARAYEAAQEAERRKHLRSV